MKVLTMLFMMFSLIGYSQSRKIDSTFKHYFKALELELSPEKDIIKNKEYFNEIELDSEKVYINKYSNDAIHFLQNISKINAPIKSRGIYMPSYVDEKTLQMWKDWYILNNKKIKWCKKEKRPYLK